MKQNKDFDLSKEKRDELLGLIKSFFQKERDEEIGGLAASAVLDFFLDKLAVEFYNQGIYDSYKYLDDRISDLLEIQK
ncbi:MAG: DUF2164 domain-containing protein [Patescibacteria group bacterium]